MLALRQYPLLELDAHLGWESTKEGAAVEVKRLLVAPLTGVGEERCGVASDETFELSVVLTNERAVVTYAFDRGGERVGGVFALGEKKLGELLPRGGSAQGEVRNEEERLGPLQGVPL